MFHLSPIKPDFLLIRQDPRDAGEDFKSVLLGLQYGQVPSINSLQSIYNFQVGSFLIIPPVLQLNISDGRISPGFMLTFSDFRTNLEKKNFL